MPVDFDRVHGYKPTLEELFEGLGISSPREMKETLLGRCRELYSEAKKSGNMTTFENSPDEFILCDSSEFYQTLVNLGFGSPALVIMDDYSPKGYFLLFTDMVPEKFRPILAAHESTEYAEMRSGTEQNEAHIKATMAEMMIAERLGLKSDYLGFVKENYPGKYFQLQVLDLI